MGLYGDSEVLEVVKGATVGLSEGVSFEVCSAVSGRLPVAVVVLLVGSCEPVSQTVVVIGFVTREAGSGGRLCCC